MPPTPTIEQVLAAGNDVGNQQVITSGANITINLIPDEQVWIEVGPNVIRAHVDGTFRIGTTSGASVSSGDGHGLLLVADGGDIEIAATGRISLVGLPTTDPAVAGALWNDAGTVKVSAG